jgi:ABC-type polysaccharide/polyol phosphate export permease
MRESLLQLWRHRLLVQSLVMRELKARYRGSVLGFLWSFLNPLMLMGVYSLVFSVYMRMPIEHYHVFVFSGLLPWLWFSASLLEGTNAIIAGAPLVKKVLFPAEILPITVVLSNLVHFALGLPILFFFLLGTSRVPGLEVLALPLVILVQLVFTLALVLLLSSLSVHYRDISQILANLVTLWFFLCPIIYSMDQVEHMVSGRYSPLVQKLLLAVFFLNPMAHVVIAYQQILYRNEWPSFLALGAVLLASIGFFVVGYHVFNRSKATFAEEV